MAAPPETKAERLAVLNRIASECRVPAATLELLGEDRLRFQPRGDEDYERVLCVLGRIEGLNLPAANVEFIGNAAAPPPELNEAVAPRNAAAAEVNNAQAD